MTTVPSALLSTVKLTKRFGGLTAVNQVSITVPAGRIVSIIGPNGAGKTTFFNLITGLEKPDSGWVFFKGREITHLASHRRIALGLGRSFQNLRLFKSLNLLENVIAGAYKLGRANFMQCLLGTDVAERKATIRRAEAALQDLGLYDLRLRFPHEVSHVERRLTELARALVGEPEILLLDEPTAGTTRSESKYLGDLIRTLTDEKKLTVLLVEHNMSVVMNYSDHVQVIDNGEKIAEGSPEQIQHDPAVIKAYLGGDTGWRKIQVERHASAVRSDGG